MRKLTNKVRQELADALEKRRLNEMVASLKQEFSELKRSFDLLIIETSNASGLFQAFTKELNGYRRSKMSKKGSK